MTVLKTTYRLQSRREWSTSRNNG